MKTTSLTDRVTTYLNRHPVQHTPYVCGLLLICFALQIIAFTLLDWSGTQFAYWLSSNPRQLLSPGTIIAPFTHLNIPHLVANVTILLVYGSATESHFSGREWGIFFLLTAYIPLHTSSLLKLNEGLGASTAVLGFVGFYHTHLLVSHRDSLVFLKTDGKILPTDERTRRYYFGLFSLLVIPLFWLFLMSGVLGIRSTGKSDALGHTLGFTMGILYAALRPAFPLAR